MNDVTSAVTRTVGARFIRLWIWDSTKTNQAMCPTRSCQDIPPPQTETTVHEDIKPLLREWVKNENYCWTILAYQVFELQTQRYVKDPATGTTGFAPGLFESPLTRKRYVFASFFSAPFIKRKEIHHGQKHLIRNWPAPEAPPEKQPTDDSVVLLLNTKTYVLFDESKDAYVPERNLSRPYSKRR
jgi:hypothetical protein